MKILLDTHVFLWIITGDLRLSKHYRDLVTDPNIEVYLSVVSVWESVVKYALGKLPLPAPPHIFLPAERRSHQIASLVVDELDLVPLAGLPRLHRDPYDRMLIAQTLRHGMALATDDGFIRQYAVNCL